MPAGNDAVFGGNVTDGGDVPWSTEYNSSARSVSADTVTVSCTFDASGNPATAAGNLVTAFKANAPTGYSASNNGATVTFEPNDVLGMKVGSSNTPVSTNSAQPTPVGNTGLNVFEKPS